MDADFEGGSVYRVTLELAIEKAESYLNNADYASMKSSLESAIKTAKTVYEKADATQSEINNAVKTLETFLSTMIGSETRNALRAAVATSKQLYSRIFYTPEGWTAYRQVLSKAAALVEDMTASDETLKKAMDDLGEAEKALVKTGYVNLALGGKAAASSTLESTEWNWGIALATDGNRKNSGKQSGEYTGYCSNLTPTKDHEEWLSVDLGSVQKINTAVFYSASSFDGEKWMSYGFPSTFRIEVSEDGKTWTSVKRVEDLPLPEYGPLVFGFEETEARYVRLYGESLRPKVSDNNSYRMQISEFEVYNLPPVTSLDSAALADAIEAAKALLDSETYTGATEAARAAFDKALALAERLLTDEGALQSELDEAVTGLAAATKQLSEQREPDPENPNPDTPDTKPEPGEKDDKDGLSTGALVAIVIGSVVVLAGAGVAVFFVIRRKKKNS